MFISLSSKSIREDIFTRPFVDGQQYGLILDVVGSRSILDFKRALNPKGTYVMVEVPHHGILSHYC